MAALRGPVTSPAQKIKNPPKHSAAFLSPMTELTFLDVFFPKAQIQAHSAGTVKLASDHWLSTYWPITGPTLPTRASLWGGEKRKGDVNAAAELGDDVPELPAGGLTPAALR